MPKVRVQLRTQCLRTLTRAGVSAVPYRRAIAGPRYRSATRHISLTSAAHPSVRANKRACLELLQGMCLEAKALASQFSPADLKAARKAAGVSGRKGVEFIR